MTGWSLNSGLLAGAPDLFAAIQPKLANIANPSRWGAYDNAWITIADIYCYIQAYVPVSTLVLNDEPSTNSTLIASTRSAPLTLVQPNSHWPHPGESQSWNSSPFSPPTTFRNLPFQCCSLCWCSDTLDIFLKLICPQRLERHDHVPGRLLWGLL
jgi:hypothetical protein